MELGKITDDLMSDDKLEYRPIKLDTTKDIECKCEECEKDVRKIQKVYVYDIKTNSFKRCITIEKLLVELEKTHVFFRDIKGDIIIEIEDGELNIVLSSLIKIRCTKEDLYLMPLYDGETIKLIKTNDKSIKKKVIYKMYTKREIIDRSERSEIANKKDERQKCERKIYRKMRQLIEMINSEIDDIEEMIRMYIDYLIE